MNRTVSSTSRELALSVRRHVLGMLHRAKSSHVGSCLSCADLLAVLYSGTLRIEPTAPTWSERDRFILSKGHAAAALYATLAETGFFPAEWLDQYAMQGSLLLGHVSHHVPGVEFSTGSLGHGLPVACGMALAFERERRVNRVFVLLSDGELDEGSNWEAILFAAQHRLSNLTAIIDCNGLQGFGAVSDVIDLTPLGDKWRACRWSVEEIDGHDHRTIETALARAGDGPRVVIAHTVKGKGVSFMENSLAWHYKSPNSAELELALAELKKE
jgi:transketolase